MRAIVGAIEVDKYAKYLEQFDLKDFHPELFVKILATQRFTAQALQISSNEPPCSVREEKYRHAGDAAANISEFIGRSACAERALLGKHILDLLDVPSCYVGGVFSLGDPGIKNSGAAISQHSYIVLPQTNGETLVFDIANQHSDGDPRIIKTAVPLTAELFSKGYGAFVEGKELLRDRRHFWGAGKFLRELQFNIHLFAS